VLKSKINGLGFKISVWFVAVCAFPAISILVVSLYVSTNILLDKSLDQLEVVANGKKNQLSNLLSDVYLDIGVLTDIGNVSVINSVIELETKAESKVSVLYGFFWSDTSQDQLAYFVLC